jgi:hypothetical protein
MTLKCNIDSTHITKHVIELHCGKQTEVTTRKLKWVKTEDLDLDQIDQIKWNKTVVDWLLLTFVVES